MAAPSVPYQAYKPKRHSRTPSAQLSSTSIPTSPSRQPSFPVVQVPQPQDSAPPPWIAEKHDILEVITQPQIGEPPKVKWERPSVSPTPNAPSSDIPLHNGSLVVGSKEFEKPFSPVSDSDTATLPGGGLEPQPVSPSQVPMPLSPPPLPAPVPLISPPHSEESDPPAPVAGPSTATHSERGSVRSSKFRRMPANSSAASTPSPWTSSPLTAPPTTPSPSPQPPQSPPRATQQPNNSAHAHQRHTSISPAPPSAAAGIPRETTPTSRAGLDTQASSSPSRADGTPPNGTPSTSTQRPPLASNRPVQLPPAYYQPGFQPKGVYRPRTDDFLEIRAQKRAVGRVDRARLQRRLEKLVMLHFPEVTLSPPSSSSPSSPTGSLAVRRPHIMPTQRRASSIFEMSLSDLKSKSAGELFKGVIQTQAQAMQNDIRGMEQTITPWENDADVTRCPFCTASFHPLTNRKHHCRLCGRIICSLPVSLPKRPVACSLLFVIDPVTGLIEEIEQGVDYGVKRRQSQLPNGMQDPKSPGKEDKSHSGIRICRSCRPILLQQEHAQEARSVPSFAKLYRTLYFLEQEIEGDLPQFQELILSLGEEKQPMKEATAARKRLVEAFAQYDAVAKRLRNLPCPKGSGSSQDRVQAAIANRANLFLQKNMFPLQSLPKAGKKKSTASEGASLSSQTIDPDSALAHALQPLLEQEALLESFVEEATVHRKFEDAKTLKANLTEIRMEIDRMVANAEVDTAAAGLSTGTPAGPKAVR